MLTSQCMLNGASVHSSDACCPMQAAMGIVKGVDFMQENNVVHTPLRLDNILVDGDAPCHVKISDFSYSKCFQGGSCDNAKKGMPLQCWVYDIDVCRLSKMTWRAPQTIHKHTMRGLSRDMQGTRIAVLTAT